MTNTFQLPMTKKLIVKTRRFDIHDRTYKFAVDTVVFTRRMPKSVEADVLRRQLVRSATSVAANLQEADGAKTKSEFRHSVSVSKKEAKESKLWLKMVSDLYPKTKSHAAKLIDECEEIVKILATIVIKTG